MRLGIKSRPKASLLWQMDIEFHQCAFGVAKLDWLKKAKAFRDRTPPLLHFKIGVSTEALVCTGRKLNSKRSHHCEVAE